MEFEEWKSEKGCFCNVYLNVNMQKENAKSVEFRIYGKISFRQFDFLFIFFFLILQFLKAMIPRTNLLNWGDLMKG